ncbi:16S rRNA (cytosine(967)-C(5))-methyltransferase RsmB [Sporolactobacillus sp. THM19-2]|uniref:16S rRNA (cytosine(967)-C(5))-methyltransferase RsmB n=1 Tax=Sporolactobacillus sp. THM19-2 TaxID=2511171 RepID=UPI0010211279|nr:16S rRNA (cytosine(967)-C(5))-methyltransferase RsmB [Sporolactobacillus sp. THM19-2]RYL92910.1 16S rRNA (cytosine(967)-C(5))-methyltransferase RsmB [Sporolactobacillus sp. THM19-2]
MKKTGARETALNLLLDVSERHAYSQIVLNDTLPESGLSARDKSLVTALVYGVLQRQLTLDYYIDFFTAGKKLDNWVRLLLELSFYQKLYMDRIPDHAIVNEAVEIAGLRGHRGISGLVNAVLRKFLREGAPPLSKIIPERRRLSVSYSHPEWLLALWIRQWGRAATVKIAESNNQPPHTYVRVNTLRTSRSELAATLACAGIHTVQGTLSPDSLMVTEGHAASAPAFLKGLCTIQDESSMLVADAVAPEAGMHVLDACAGPGGKTTHLAERMHNEGQIMALDLHAHKTRLIARTAERLGLTNIRTLALDARKASEHFEKASFDRVLLDVPCSGFGVIRRKPEIRWEKNEEGIRHLCDIQNDLLEATAPLVRPGGLFVYSTCTINKAENEWQLTRFLRVHPEFEWDRDFLQRLPGKAKPFLLDDQSAMLQILPFQTDSDGFFIGCLRRK